jgi:hypothetical protein
MYGRTLNDRAVVEADLRDGIYRLLRLKSEYRRTGAADEDTPILEGVAAGD